MKNSLMLAGILTSLSMSTAVNAFDENCAVPLSKWQSRVAVRNLAVAQGWKVRRIKIDDGCYEINGFDGAGREIEVRVNPATLAIVEFEYEDGDDIQENQSTQGDDK